MEHVPAYELANRHCQVGNQSYARNPDSRIKRITRCQVDIILRIMVVVVVMVVVTAMTMASCLRSHHGQNRCGRMRY